MLGDLPTSPSVPLTDHKQVVSTQKYLANDPAQPLLNHDNNGKQNAPDELPSKCRKRCLCTLWILTMSGVVACLAIFVILPSLTKYRSHIIPAEKVPPTSPRNLTVGSIEQTRCRPSWRPPSNQGSSAIISYILMISPVQLSPSARSTNIMTINCSTTVCPIEDLHPNTRYAVEVRACNTQLCGEWSLPTMFSTLKITTPNAPNKVVPTNTSMTTISLEWNTPNCHGKPCDGYTMLYEKQIPVRAHSGPLMSSLRFSSPAGIWTKDPNCTITHLGASTTFQFSVVAHNAVGNSTRSPVAVLHTSSPNAVVPQAPQLTGGDQTATSVSWYWQPPTQDGGAQILFFQLQSNLTGTMSDVGKFVWQSNTTLFNLRAMTIYCARIAAINAIGSSPWSQTVCQKTKRPVAPSQAVIVLPPLNDTGSSLTVGISLSSDGGINISNYQVLSDNWWTGAPLQNFANVSVPKVTRGSLFPSMPYAFRVRAWNSVGPGTWSQVANITTAFKGACGNPADAATFFRTKSTMKTSIQGCIIGCVASGPSCVINCVHTKVGLSTPCAQCWADEGQCTLKNCVQPCIRPSSDACKQCSEQKCFPDCVKCSGVPREYFPP